MNPPRFSSIFLFRALAPVIYSNCEAKCLGSAKNPLHTSLTLLADLKVYSVNILGIGQDADTDVTVIEIHKENT